MIYGDCVRNSKSRNLGDSAKAVENKVIGGRSMSKSAQGTRKVPHGMVHHQAAQCVSEASGSGRLGI